MTNFAQSIALTKTIRQNIQQTIIGQEQVIDEVLTALLAGGHVLIEGVPGLGKTLLVQSIAQSFSCQFRRIQFTPDLMPTDITGGLIYDNKNAQFRLHKGPIFTNFLLADEINRSPAKTQAALLEVMQEKQVTIEGKSLPLSEPFMVLATQNPLEQEGTYRLPEAQLDRFLLCVRINYPSESTERTLLNTIIKKQSPLQHKKTTIENPLSPENLLQLQNSVQQIHIDPRIIEYTLKLVRKTRNFDGLQSGASPRAGIALLLCARAKALLNEREYVALEDIQELAYPVLRHRIFLSADAEIENLNPDEILERLIKSTAVPRE